ncbi:MAG TPA: DUF6457 domain-containing protein [Acidimicrobiales bacterium]|nr:MAG: hypothetical protein B7Z69_04275 [Actinobacteria bacterium 21-73-9]HQU26171.1 DUF6457 domain-containing protein [Acidimicrobiales bacterium]
MATDAEGWIEAFARALGLDAPSAPEREAILALAGVAAHASERTAAPLACWLAARAGLDPEAARALAGRIEVEPGGAHPHPGGD